MIPLMAARIKARVTKGAEVATCPHCGYLAAPMFYLEISAGRDIDEWITSGSACYKCLGVRTQFFMSFADAEVKTDAAEVVTPRKRRFFKIDQAPDRK